MYPKQFPTATEHDYNDMNESGYWVCSTCGHSVKIKRGGVCPGVMVYWRWEDVPDTLATKTTLYKEHGLKPSQDQHPAGAKAIYNRKRKHEGAFHPLYEISEAEPKKTATPQQLKALEKARHMAERLKVTCSKCGNYECDRWGDIEKVTRKYWQDNNYDNYICSRCNHRDEIRVQARAILEDKNGLILDTETTDIDGEIIEIAIINMQGETLYNQRIKPQGEVSHGAYTVHGISTEELQSEPTFDKVHSQIKSIIEGMNVYIYNLSFDTDRIYSDEWRHELEHIEIGDDSTCIMNLYAEYVGQWSNYWKSYQWLPLTGGDHTALGDCLATLEVIKRMAHRNFSD